jgi:WD40 repeat protein
VRLLNVTQTAQVDCLAFSPDGSRVAAGCKKANVRVWDSGSGKPAFNLKGTKDSEFVGFTADPDKLLVSSWNTTPILWNLNTLSQRAIPPLPRYCWDTAVSRDGTRIARAEGPIACRDIESGRTLWQVECSNQSGIHTRVRFDASGKRLFVVAKRLAILDAATGAELGGFDLTFRKYATVYGADVSPDGRWLVTRGYDGMQVRDTADGRVVFEEPSITYGYALVFTPDGSQLAAGLYSGEGGIRFWDVGTWRPAPFLNLGIGTVLSLAFSPDGLLGAAGGFRGQIALWDRE